MADISLYQRPATQLTIALLDGITRAGKFLLGKVVSHFERVEYYQYAPLFEHIPILWKHSLLSTNDAVAYLRLAADTHVYDLAVGRNLNFRPDDSSAIIHSSDLKRYLERAILPEGPQALERLAVERRMPSFLIHEMLPFAELYFLAFPTARILNIQRHPVDVIHSWHQKGWGHRFFEPDHLSFVPTLRDGDRRLPWFGLRSSRDVMALKPVDRVIDSVLTINRLEQAAVERADPAHRAAIHLITYEHLVQDPQTVIPGMASFLETEAMPAMEAVLHREGCYRLIPVSEGRQKLADVAREASTDLMEELEEATRKYESARNLDTYLA